MSHLFEISIQKYLRNEQSSLLEAVNDIEPVDLIHFGDDTGVECAVIREILDRCGGYREILARMCGEEETDVRWLDARHDHHFICGASSMDGALPRGGGSRRDSWGSAVLSSSFRIVTSGILNTHPHFFVEV